MRKLKITIGRFALRVDLYDTATAAADPSHSHLSPWKKSSDSGSGKGAFPVVSTMSPRIEERRESGA